MFNIHNHYLTTYERFCYPYAIKCDFTLYCVEINEQFFKKSPIFKENLPYFDMSN